MLKSCCTCKELTMHSENRYDSSKMSFERKAVGDECASPDVLAKHRKSKILAVRDFPKGCGPPKRLSSQVLENSVQFEVPGTTDDSKSKDRLMVPFDSKQELGSMTQVELLHTYVSQILICETAGLPIKAMQNVAKVHPPRRSISAIRCFPQGCGRNAPQLDKEVVPESIALKTDGLGHNIPDVENESFRKKGEATSEGGHQKNIASTGDRNMFQSYAECLEIEKKKPRESGIDKCLEGELSGYDSMYPLQEMASTNLKLPGRRVIVQALMAAPNCPWRQGKRKLKKH